MRFEIKNKEVGELMYLLLSMSNIQYEIAYKVIQHMEKSNEEKQKYKPVLV